MRISWMTAALLGVSSFACSSSSVTSAGSDGGSDAAASAAPGDPPACSGNPTSGGGPTPRGDVAAALDASGAKMVVHGGDSAFAACPGMVAPKHEGDTWVLDVGCGAWKSIASAGPGARARASMITDPSKNRAILFGGRTRAAASGPYTLLNDVWAFDFASESWAKVDVTGTAPTPRSNGAMVYDAKQNQLVVFGGNGSTDPLTFAPLDDTYALDLAKNEWRKLSSGASPPARLFHAMAIDAEGRRAWIFSGGDANAFAGPFLRDTWQLDLDAGTWAQLAPAGTPPLGRIKHGMVYDGDAKRVLMFGGHDDGEMGNENEVDALDVSTATPAWAKLPGGDTFNKAPVAQCKFAPDFTTIDVASPERRAGFAFAPRTDGRGFFVWGGKGDCGLLGDGWWFSAKRSAWTNLEASPVGLSCLRISTTCSGLCG